jgi:hypothetical protein
MTLLRQPAGHDKLAVWITTGNAMHELIEQSRAEIAALCRR